MNKQILIYILFLGILIVPKDCFSQKAKIQLIDAEKNVPVFLAHIKFTSLSGESKGNYLWSVSDANGFAYNPFLDTTMVDITFVGYKSVSRIIYPKSTTVIALEEDVFGLNEVVVTGHFIPIEQKDYVYDVITINKQQLLEKGATNLREALGNELNIKTNNGHVNETALTLNGLSGNHIKIMIDGVPVEGRLNGNVDLSQINTSEIERIEIIDGPSSVTYGTNALGGVVNLITKKYQYKKIAGSFKTYYETVGQYNFSGSIGFKKKKNTVKLNLGRHFFDGFALQDTSRFKDWKPREQYFGSLLFNRKLKKLRFVYIFNGFDEHITSRGRPRTPYYINAFDTHYRTNRFSNKGLLKGRISKFGYLNLTLSQSYYRRTRTILFKDLVTLDETPTAGSNDQDTTVFNAYLIRGVYKSNNDSSKVNYMLGFEGKRDQIKSNRVAGKVKSISDFAIFGDLKYKPQKGITIQPAFRYAYNTKYKAPIIPSINFLFNLSENSEFRASYAKGFRAPSLKELYIEFHYNSTINLFGNENLSSENSDHVNLSYTFHKKHKKHGFSVSPKLYYSKINNLMKLVPLTNVDWQYSNIDFLTTKGSSLAFGYSFRNIEFNSAVSYYGNYNSQYDNNGKENKYFYSSDVSNGLRIKLDSSKTIVNLKHKYTGRIRSFYFDDNKKLKESKIASYNTIDASVSRGFVKNKLKVAVGVKNLMNVTNVNMVGQVFGVSKAKEATALSVLWGRSFFVSMNYKF